MINTTIFGPVRGRIGNLVAYTRMGKQVFRSINDRPQNPQTPAQMAQRTLMASVVEAYKVLAPFVSESYETKPPSLTAYNRFVSNNLKQVKARLNKAEACAKACIATEYNISEGTLPPIEMTPCGNRLISSLKLPPELTFTPQTTVGDVARGLVKMNPALIYGDKITILHLIQTGAGRPGEGETPRATLQMHEFTLDSASRVPFQTLVPEALFGRGPGGFAGTGDTLRAGSMAYVHSRKVKRITRYSTQSLVLIPGDTVKPLYESDEKCRQAGESYQKRRKTPTSKTPPLSQPDIRSGCP